MDSSTIDFPGRSLFGHASRCASLAEVAELMCRLSRDDARAATAAYGMVLSVHLVAPGPYRDDALKALDQLVRAKAELDIAALHLRPVVDVTASILRAAQTFAEEATIPCTEWPTVNEICEVVLREARRFAKVDRWEV